MPDPLILYSTNSLLAYSIAEEFYQRTHYVWCSPFFLPPNRLAAAPPTAIPGEIYENLWQETSRNDRHSHFIKRNKIGILRGAEAKLAEGIIDEDQQSAITEIVSLATPADFRPVLYVIPYDRTKKIIEDVPPRERAHPLSKEFRIPRLPWNAFDALELRRWL